MRSFSDLIQDLELIDLPLQSAHYTWYRGEDSTQAARIDRFLISTDWSDNFGAVNQLPLPKVTSDHRPIVLESGDWSANPSYFKFERGRAIMLMVLWITFCSETETLEKGYQQMELRGIWQSGSQGKQTLDELLILEQATEGRMKIQEEKSQILNLKLEIRRLAKAEEASWGQKSRFLWLKESDRNTKFFQRVANANRNTTG